MTPPIVPDHELLRPIGRGAYGDVWLARNIMGAWRAVKVVHRDRFDSERPYEREFEGIRRYEPVSRSADGLVQVLHVGRDDRAGCFYYVMELADDAHVGTEELRREDGQVVGSADAYEPRTLRRELQRRGAFSTAEVLAIGSSLAAGLAHLHSRGLVHRDVKPSNIVFIHGRARLADHGLVRVQGAGLEGTTFVGTEGYIPPEGPGTPVADLYALGMVLYEAATGGTREQFPEIPQDWLRGGPSAAAALELYEIVLKAGEGDPRRRYQRATELQADLALVQAGQSVRQAREVARKVRLFRRLAVVAVVGLVIAGAVASFASWRSREAAANSRREAELRRQAEASQRDARAQLAAARFAEAAALRRSGQPGQRHGAWRGLAEAARERGNTAELRREAAAALCLPELQVREDLARQVAGRDRAGFDPALTRSLVIDAQGNVLILDRSDNAELGRLEHPMGAAAKEVLPGLSTTNGFVAIRHANGEIVYWNLEFESAATRFTNTHARCALDTSLNGKLLAFVRPEADGVEVRALGHGRPEIHFLPVGSALAAHPSPDGTELAVTTKTNPAVTLMRTSDGRVRGWLPLPSMAYWWAWSSDGRWLATLSLDRRLRVWDVLSLHLRRELPGVWGEGSFMQFVPGAPLLATGGWHARLQLWDPVSGRPWIETLGPGAFFRFDPTAREMLLWRWENEDLLRFEVEVRRPFVELVSPPMTAGDERISERAAAFSSNERYVAIAGAGGVRVWDWAAGRLARVFPGVEGWGARWKPDDSGLLLDTDQGSRSESWATESQPTPEEAPATTNARAGDFGRSAWSADGTLHAYVRRNSLHLEATGRRKIEIRLLQTPDRVVLSPDGTLVAVSFWKGEIQVFGTDNGLQRWNLKSRPSADVAFSPDNAWLVSGSGEEYRFWKRPDFTPGLRLVRAGFQANQGPMAFSADGRRFAWALSRTEIVVASMPDGAELIRLENPNGWQIESLSFSPSGRLLAVGSNFGVTTIWKLAELNRSLSEIGLGWETPAR